MQLLAFCFNRKIDTTEIFCLTMSVDLFILILVLSWKLHRVEIMCFESAHFKLSQEMTQLLDPSGVMKNNSWYQFVSLCVKGYLTARRYMDGIINTILLMIDSGLPCFSRGDPIGNHRKRFHPEMSEREAAIFMICMCSGAYNKWTTAGYDLIQHLQQGIEK